MAPSTFDEAAAGGLESPYGAVPCLASGSGRATLASGEALQLDEPPVGDLWQMRTCPRSTAPPMPVVMGVVVDVDKREGSETTNAAASGRSQTLAEMVSILRQQLGLGGNMREVVEQAAQQLGTERSSREVPPTWQRTR